MEKFTKKINTFEPIKKYSEKTKNEIYSLIKENVTVRIDGNNSYIDGNGDISLNGIEDLTDVLYNYVQQEKAKQEVLTLEKVKLNLALGKVFNIKEVNEHIEAIKKDLIFMNNLKIFEQWVSENFGSSIDVIELNRLLNDKRFSKSVIENFRSLKWPYKKVLLSFIEKKTLDLPKILKTIKRFNLIEKFKRKKGNLNDKIEQVSKEVESTNEEFFIETFAILIATIVTCFLLGSGLLLILQGTREHDSSDTFLGIVAICVWILIVGGAWEGLRGDCVDSDNQKTEQSVKKSDNIAADSDTNIVKQIKTEDGKTINLIIIKKGDTYLVEEVK